MKNLLIIGFFIAISNYSFAQIDHENLQNLKRGKNKSCDTRVQQLDSLVNYTIDSFSGNLTPAYVIKYVTDENYNNLTVTRINLPGREFFYNQIFNYNNSGNLTEYIYQEWSNGSWTDKSMVSYLYDVDNNLQMELLSRKDVSGNWEVYQKHFYEYEDGKISRYLRQEKDINGNWYDFSYHNYVYDSAGRLVILFGQYINNNVIFWKRTTIFDETGKASERYLQVLKYDPTVKKNVLTNVTHQIYSYDIYGDINELRTENWINNNWEYSNKHIYYWSLIPGKKVNICHNGNQICVSTSAVKAHLHHGDKLGECAISENNNQDKKDTCSPGLTPKLIEKDFRIYPNPFTSELRVNFISSNHKYNKAILLTREGRIIKSTSVKNRSELVFNLPELMSGTYFLRLSGETKSDYEIVIKK